MFGGASFAVNLGAVSYRLINLFEFNLLSRKEIRRLKILIRPQFQLKTLQRSKPGVVFNDVDVSINTHRLVWLNSKW